MKPLVLSLLSCLFAAMLFAMPTAEEIAAAEPLVQEVMKAEMDALRSGKKTREQVGDAAVALAKAAQAPAEKYILLTGAFDYYMRGGAYDKAASALEAVRKAVPDWKGSDEFALIDKAMRVVAFGKGGPVRERYEELKERQQYAIRLKKALEQAKAKPSDKKLQFQVATYSAALGHWPQAVDAFLAANSPACAAAAKLEKESAPPAKIADAWWSASDIRPAFLSSAIRAHAVDLYKKALDSNSLAGLQKVAAEKRIKEATTTRGVSLGDAAIQSGRKPYTAEIEYLESTGSQYIDTGIAPSSAISETSVFEAVVPHATHAAFLYGTGNDGGRQSCGMCCNKGVVTYWNGSVFVSSGTPYSATQKYEIRRDTNTFSVNGKEISAKMAGDATSNLSMYLFARHNTNGKSDNYSSVRMYSYQVKSGGKVILDLIPVRVGRVGHLYDKVSKKLYSNKGEGAFVLGKDKR